MRTTFLLFGLLFSSLLFAQNNSTVGVHFHGFLPTGELKRDASEIWGGGFGMEAAFQIKESPIYLGGTLDFTRYGSEVRKGFHSESLQDVRFRHHNEMVRLMPFVRVKPETDSRFMPYADFTFGAGYIYTRARVYDRDIDEVVDQFTQIDDYVFTYGLGGGIEYIIDEAVSLDFFVKYAYSTRSDYLTPKTITYDPDIEGYQLDVQQSRFNALTFGFGLKILIGEL